MLLSAFQATLAEARRRDQVDPIQHEQVLLERGGFRFPEHRFLEPKEIWEELILGYMKVALWTKQAFFFETELAKLYTYRHMTDSSRLKVLVLCLPKKLATEVNYGHSRLQDFRRKFAFQVCQAVVLEALYICGWYTKRRCLFFCVWLGNLATYMYKQSSL